VEDLVQAMEASLIEGKLSRQTVSITGPEEMGLGGAVRRVASTMGRHPLFFRSPIFFHCILGFVLEQIMTVPLVSLAQVRILSEGIVEPLPPCDPLPEELMPRTPFSESQIRHGLPEAGRFGLRDLRWFA
jgi:NADH dehydrogenase